MLRKTAVAALIAVISAAVRADEEAASTVCLFPRFAPSLLQKETFRKKEVPFYGHCAGMGVCSVCA